MPGIEIACPQCGRKLKLPDRSMLGRKGRCSKCRHGFIMQAPEVKAIQFAEAPAPSSGQANFEFAEADENLDDDTDQTLMGVAVRLITDAPRASDPLPAALNVAAASPPHAGSAAPSRCIPRLSPRSSRERANV